MLAVFSTFQVRASTGNILGICLGILGIYWEFIFEGIFPVFWEHTVGGNMLLCPGHKKSKLGKLPTLAMHIRTYRAYTQDTHMFCPDLF
jgi:hypothetical protein